MKRWLREPLLHFLVIGALLFAVDALWTRNDQGEQRIVVSAARVRALAQNFARTWQRAPTGAELDALIEEHVRDEILERDAVRLGLDRDDAVIRRRLRQKLEIITEEAAAATAPTQADLQAWLDAHREVFRGESRIAFEQVFFDPARRGERLEADLAAALRTLQAAQHAADAKRRATTTVVSPGDPLFVLQPSYPLTGARAIGAQFGEEFATALAATPEGDVGRWIGPIASGYGRHLVRVTRVEPGATPALTEIGPWVEREWRNAQRIAARDRHYQALRARYRVDIVKDPPR